MEERGQDLRSTLSSAISYPAFLAVFSLAVVVFVLVVVFPKFDDLFEMLGDQLPASTRLLMATSDLLTRFWPALLAGLAAAGVALQRWLARPEGTRALDRLLLRTPIVRDIVIQLNVVQLLRVLALALENGVPAVDALSAAQDGVRSGAFREFLGRVAQGVREGRGIARSFESEALLPELVKQLVATGEESGNLAPVMHRLAVFYEREWRRSLGIVAKIAEPAMLMLMGCVVGLVVSSLILPIFKVSRVVN
jgi:type II secretory pathway component PulF